MPSEREINIIQKAAMYDLIEILKENQKEAYTLEELERVIKAYLKGNEN